MSKTVKITIEIDEHTFTMLKAATIDRTYLTTRRLGLDYEQPHWTIEQIAGEMLDEIYAPDFKHWDKLPY
ncbi:MAG: hypothetical protein KDJ36_00165 [Hyphomicrobiaceae bacterium]|nr:hypothetical protein [Hyphomicrobiaceae bacterium]